MRSRFIEHIPEQAVQWPVPACPDCGHGFIVVRASPGPDPICVACGLVRNWADVDKSVRPSPDGLEDV
jgi:hypothetical protein